jgi:UDP-N-acetylmuramoylalanine--D-glutamate ligase
MDHPSAYQNRRVVVLGMAKSGTAVAKLFLQHGALVTINDLKERAQCEGAAELESLGATVICGHHPDDLLDPDVALVVKNPGIPYSVPPLVRAAELGLEVVTEVEVAYQVCATAHIIGITGSNGKTTTTTWIGEALAAAGMRTTVAGNIGLALSDVAASLRADDRLVVELSSFQLLGTQTFRPQIAVLLNFAETHLDYHGTMEHYVAAKLRLFQAMTSGYAVLNADDARVCALIPDIRAQVVLFSRTQALAQGVFVQNGMITARFGADEQSILPTAELGIPGQHNVENALAVTAAALCAGVPASVLREVLRSFRGVEHRLEWVRTVDGVRYYNDSKATNPQATMKAIDGFAGGVILLAGGLDRGSDYMELVEPFAAKLKGIVTIGETRGKLALVAEKAGVSLRAVIDGAGGEQAPATIGEAVRLAAAWAQSGDVVLLSPACASWDMFTSYEVRGRIFKESVHTL